ncbi:hypothetical protein MUK42_27363 [Musa troglodytarum]|uniref:RRM domain-containing protein n=1 Tax=Musa troglodytarum TaxID=320322 RepID=A0A9E7JPY0_9LILI|nr:hypothetical protein MUK42_27363 [Musa troglodytarum]
MAHLFSDRELARENRLQLELTPSVRRPRSLLCLERTVFVDIDAFGEGRGASRSDDRDGNKGNEIKDGDKTMAVVVLGVQGLVVVEDEGEDEVGDVMKGMQRTRASAAAAATDPEPANPHEHEEQVALDDPEELMEDKVEYEEVEKEVEEKEEEVVEEELEEEEQETDVANVSNAGDAAGGDASMVEGEKDDDESKKHAELLALPPNGSEIYVRVMKAKDSTENKGYASVTFKTKELASKAIEELNNTEFKSMVYRRGQTPVGILSDGCLRHQNHGCLHQGCSRIHGNDEPLQKLFMAVNLDLKNIKTEQAKCWKQTSFPSLS